MSGQFRRLILRVIYLLVASSLLLSCQASKSIIPHAPSLNASYPGSGLVAVLTDYGTTDFYVGALEGAMYKANPRVRITSITHHIEPFNVAEGSYVLVQAAREFPPGTVFLAVVDPGVGTARRCILVQTPDHKLFVAPDNGLLSGVIEKLGVAHAYEIRNHSLMRQGGVSATFHGRDILGPVAAHLAGDIQPSEVGPKITDLIRLPVTAARHDGDAMVGSVVHVDRYGNMITNIPATMVKQMGFEPGTRLQVTIGGKMVAATLATAYGDVPEGSWLALINAEKVLEIARNLANAAETVGAKAGAEVRLE